MAPDAQVAPGAFFSFAACSTYAAERIRTLGINGYVIWQLDCFQSCFYKALQPGDCQVRAFFASRTASQLNDQPKKALFQIGFVDSICDASGRGWLAALSCRNDHYPAACDIFFVGNCGGWGCHCRGMEGIEPFPSVPIR